jgi:hypothetical protein
VSEMASVNASALKGSGNPVGLSGEGDSKPPATANVEKAHRLRRRLSGHPTYQVEASDTHDIKELMREPQAD